MSFKLVKKLDNGVRVGELTTVHGVIKTPFFMPVGTVGSVKSVAPWELNELGASVVLSNTYHLYLRPGEQLIKKFGGLHQFMGWDGPILTDSGGYQVFSLAQKKQSLNQDLVRITEDGVEFKSHLDGSKHFFTPEKVIDIQLDLGVDILMPLDVCPSGKASYGEIKAATELTVRWARRAKKHFELRIMNYELRNRPQLHGIVQGGLDEGLRRWCAEKLIEMDFDGYSVGGLAVDNETRDMWSTVKLMGEILPENKQRYLMGVGTPDDIIKATKLGMDMFDCVLPTRLGRHGSVYIKDQIPNTKNQILNSKDNEDQESNENGEQYRLVNLLNSQFREDPQTMEQGCGCPACSRGLSRAYISHLVRAGEILGIRLTTMHNLWQYLNLMAEIRKF